jgi:hypothetical protein
VIAASGQLVGIATFHLLGALLIARWARVAPDASPAARAQARAAGHVWKFLAVLGVLLAAVGLVI